MRVAELTTGRTFALAMDHGEDFFPTLEKFCADNSIRSGYIPTFLGAYRNVRLVGACGPLENPEAPVWDEVVVETVEMIGTGTLAWDQEADRLAPHVHVSTGLKAEEAHARTSHLLGAEVQFINELIVVEVTSPIMTRPRNAKMYDVPVWTFEGSG